jgi:hypothetical protein
MIKKFSATLAAAALLMMSFTVTSCSIPAWENPISSVGESQADDRLPGAWEEVDLERGTRREMLWIGNPVDGWMSFAYLFSYSITLDKVQDEKLFGKFYVSRLNGRTFLNVRMVGDNGSLSQAFLLIEYRIDKGRLWLYFPDAHLIKSAIDREELLGSAEGNDDGWLIHSESAQMREFIRKSGREKVFSIVTPQPPIQLRKLR